MKRKHAIISLICFSVGLVFFGFGLWLAWPPLGPIGVGVILMAISLFGDKQK